MKLIAGFMDRDALQGITLLDLSDNFIGVQGLQHLARALPGSALETLCLAQCGVCHSAFEGTDHAFEPGAVDELMDALPESRLRSLDLGDNILTGFEPHPRSRSAALWGAPWRCWSRRSRAWCGRTPR